MHHLDKRRHSKPESRRSLRETRFAHQNETSEARTDLVGPNSDRLGDASGGSVSPKRRSWLGWLIALGAILLLLVFALDVPAKSCQHFARKAIMAFDYEGAERWIARATSVSPQNADNELLAARVCRRQGQLDEMSKHLTRANVLGGDRRASKIEEALALAQSGDLTAVEPQLIAWLKEGAGDADEISDAYANGLAANSRFEQSATVLQAWRTDYPTDPRPDYRMGRLREYLEEWDEAERAYREAIRLNPNYFAAHYRLGRVLLLGRRIEEAINSFGECLKMQRPQAAQVQLAGCYRALADQEQAAKLLREVLTHDRKTIALSYQDVDENPETFDAAAWLGDIESEGGNHDEAFKWLSMALAENPRDLAARYSLAVTLRALGKDAEAEGEFEKVRLSRAALERANPLRDRIKRNPKDLEARAELGTLLLEHESQRMGRFWLQSILPFESRHQVAHAGLAKSYSELAERSPQFKPLAQYHQRAAAEAAASNPETAAP